MEFISTHDIPSARRIRFWQDAVSALYTETAICHVDSSGFHGEIAWTRIGDVIVSEIASSSQTVRREDRHIRRSDGGLVQINLQLEGTGCVLQDGRRGRTGPGEIVLYDSSRPYEMIFDGPFRQFSIDFPREILRERFGPVQGYTARAFSGDRGPGRFLFSFIRDLMRGENEEDESIINRLQAHLIDLVITSLCGLMPLIGERNSRHRTLTLNRIKTFILANLRDSTLSPAMIAQAEGLSLRYIYDLFGDEGVTVARYILATRLDRCRIELEDTKNLGRSISEICFAWGFGDPAHFSRAFRSRFGMTPRECRTAATALAIGTSPGETSPTTQTAGKAN